MSRFFQLYDKAQWSTLRQGYRQMPEDWMDNLDRAKFEDVLQRDTYAEFLIRDAGRTFIVVAEPDGISALECASAEAAKQRLQADRPAHREGS